MVCSTYLISCLLQWRGTSSVLDPCGAPESLLACLPTEASRMPPQGPPAVTFADESNLDSDNEDERTSGLASSSSTSKSPGVTLGFDDGPMPPSSSSSLEANGDGQQDDQLNVEVSRIGGRLAVRSSSFREPVPSERSCMACEVQEDLFQDEEVRASLEIEETDSTCIVPGPLPSCPDVVGNNRSFHWKNETFLPWTCFNVQNAEPPWCSCFRCTHPSKSR